MTYTRSAMASALVTYCSTRRMVLPATRSRIRPRSGRCRPPSTRSNVLFPAPFGPSTAARAPSGSCKDTPCTARRLPYDAQTPSASSNAGTAHLHFLTEVRRAHRGVALHLLGGSLGDEPPEVHHRDPVAHPHHQVQVVFDEQDAQPVVPDQPREHLAKTSGLALV